MSTPGIQTTDLSVGYGRRVVASGLNLELRPAQVVCLLGPNGSGKSTLLRTLLGLQPPLGGTVQLAGRALADWTRTALARQLAYVPQAQEPPFSFTVEQWVLMGCASELAWFAQPRAQDRAWVRACLTRLGIAHLAEQRLDRISGGERQLALIARALVQRSRFLIMDEPASSLDFANQVRVLDQIAHLRGEGLGVLLCTHQPEHAARVADWVVLYRDGGILAQGEPCRMLSRGRLRQLYQLPDHAFELPHWYGQAQQSD
ncbi:MAG TPA: ABC transporter ATP-binding protein [Alcaligenes sp.]|nr:ABC transporter ATP-binding protein [Alcaligenes sp.]HRL27723.1 ABC transporter ATP-binding protein [Alcaligenes sp.]